MSQRNIFERPITLDSLPDLFAHNRALYGGYHMEDTGGGGGSGDGGTGSDGDKGTGGDGGTGAGDKGGDQDKDKGTGGDGGDLGFPKDTPVAEMDSKQQAAYYKHQNRKGEGRNAEWKKVAGDRTPEQVAADLKRLADLDKEKMTPSEKAIAEAEERGQAKARQALAPEMTRLAFEGHFTHLPPERATVILDGINFAQFVDPSTGKVDTAKVAAHAEAIAPKPGKGGSENHDYGSGRRRSSTGSSVAAGREAYEATKRKPASTS